MPINAGITDSGSATAVMNVARQSRKNSHTTSTASSAPSASSVSDAWYSSCTGVTKSKASVNSISGWVTLSCSSAARTPRPTSISLDPLAREISNPTTGTPLSKAAERCSAIVSCTSAIWPSLALRPSPKLSSSAASSAADLTEASVRTGCSLLPRSARPPAVSICTCRNCCDTAAALTPSDCILALSNATRISRVTPPTRVTEPTPRTASKSRVSVSSTNQLSASSSSALLRMV